MDRKKVKLAYITDDKARKISYNKMKNNIIKKVNELTTLYGVEACVIIPSSFDSKPEIWPNVKGAKKVIERYQNTPVKKKNMTLNQESFMTQMTSKSQDKLSKVHQLIREKELTMPVFNCVKDGALPEGLTVTDINDIKMHLEKMMKEVNDEIAKRNLSNVISIVSWTAIELLLGTAIELLLFYIEFMLLHYVYVIGFLQMKQSSLTNPIMKNFA
ncbi:agamous-like MADS-box protein AGL80 [Lotus japonicus]|uniref:agamous-like MADS-box protein AGL80 n=1 Tax=Lotus japonicus TaxID=34305 RepID=UPI00258514F3|nr:agamous-like MADS-box protein AGL80 [Lotus japonicus]